MGLTALKGKKSKKKTIRSKARTGLAGVPIEKGFDAVKEYYGYSTDKALQALRILNNEQLEEIKRLVNKGGRR